MSRTVFVVDDNALTRALLSDALRASGFEPVAYASAREALRALEVSAPAACVVDHTMPDMTGAEFIRALRSSPDAARRALPVVGVTARFADELVAAGADVCIPKPFTEAAVAAAVNGAMARRAPGAQRQASAAPSLAEFRQLHQRARAGGLSAADAALYRAMRSELAQTFLAMQHAAMPARSRARRALRVAARLRVDLHLGAQPVYAHSADLGQGGFSVVLAKAPPAGARVRFRLQLGEVEWIEGQARVANVLPGPDGSERAGFAFVGLGADQLDRVEMRVFDAVMEHLDAARGD